MKKHIIGLALFSFIVSAAAIAYAIFNVPEIIPVSVVPEHNSTNLPTSCWKMKRNSKELKGNAPVIKQAVFNLKTRQFNWELVGQQPASRIALHFFIKDANGTRYLNSIFVSEGNFENGVIKAASSSRWLDNLKLYENTYIIPEYISDDKYNDKNYQPNFDATKATPVTIDYGK